MAGNEGVVFVVDDDASMRHSTECLIRSIGLNAMTFASADQFLKHKRPDTPACLLLDMRMPGLSGLDLQKELAQAGVDIPIIFITGHGDIPMTVQAMKAGAIEFLTKPYRDQDLIDAVRKGLKRDGVARTEQTKLRDLKRRFDSLTPREREVMTLVVSGLLNKQIAAQLGSTEQTVKFHRGHIMQKMQAVSLADLVRMSESLSIGSANQR
jgi:FixJ family two-component response regulator